LITLKIERNQAGKKDREQEIDLKTKREENEEKTRLKSSEQKLFTNAKI